MVKGISDMRLASSLMMTRRRRTGSSRGRRVGISVVVLTFILVVSPYRVMFDGPSPTLGPQTAWAKDGGNGSGNGNGNGNGNSGNPGGNSGNSNSNSNAGNDKAKSQEDNPPDLAPAANPDSKPKLFINATTGDRVEVSGPSIGVVHSNGLSERIDSGQYEMRDAKGRTIIRRLATRSDRDRLLEMIN
ncbi:hypothetical protein [Mesorhizobium sp. M1378]|uniref:hypothetical protein n=1 Tax=Mesorhizobium sp. M1378 TaxID=2957092 RepID=UPI003335B730